LLLLEQPWMVELLEKMEGQLRLAEIRGEWCLFLDSI
jgi:hypothetical protein